METLYGKLILPGINEIVGTGWLPPRPDLPDYTQDKKEIKEFNKKLGITDSKQKAAATVDLRKWFSPVENQGNLGSCTAHAGAGIVEYFEKRAYERHLEASRLFLYKTTRNLMQVTGDAGGWLRCTMGALVLCGVPAEKYWPYNIGNYDVEPDAFIYSVADNYCALKYFCHDPIGAKVPYPDVLDSVKKYLGYDDEKKIRNTENNQETTGAILIRNSWGKEWGDKGYGWLPYDYVLNNLALDFWSLLGMDWIDSKQFGI